MLMEVNPKLGNDRSAVFLATEYRALGF